MSRRTALAIIGAALLLAIILVIVWSGDEEPSQPESSAPESIEVLPDDVEGVPVELFFPDEGGRLTAEQRRVEPWSTPEHGARTLLTALLAGPEDPTLSAPMPPEAALGPVHLTVDNVLYVDLVSTELARPPSTGSQMELLSIWSVVDTVALGIPEVESVVILWNSRQLTSFAGHVDTSLPLAADLRLIRGRR